jgi:hypothetical protein
MADKGKQLKYHGDVALGVRIVRTALEPPLRQLVDNAGIEGSLVVQEVRNGQGQLRLQCCLRPVLRPGKGRRAGPGQGDALCPAECRKHCGSAADNRVHHHGHPRGEVFIGCYAGRHGWRHGRDDVGRNCSTLANGAQCAPFPPFLWPTSC